MERKNALKPGSKKAGCSDNHSSSWQCSSCTYINRSCLLKCCEMCDRPKRVARTTRPLQQETRVEPTQYQCDSNHNSTEHQDATGERRQQRPTIPDHELHPGAFAVGDEETREEASRNRTNTTGTSQNGIFFQSQEQEEPVIAHVVDDAELEDDVLQRILREREEQLAIENRVRQQVMEEQVRAEMASREQYSTVDTDESRQSNHSTDTASSNDGLRPASGVCDTASSNDDDVRSSNPESDRSGSPTDNRRPHKIGKQLFGVSGSNHVDIASSPDLIRTRTRLPWSVSQNKTTKKWIATLHTNQKALETNNTVEADKGCISYSFSNRLQANTVGRQLAPPEMIPFEEKHSCHVCKATFGVFRRAMHCRNCGVCICSSCSKTLPSKMVPETFNIRKAAAVNVCKACDWLSTSFRSALLKGRLDKAMNLYETGNINLTAPFANVEGGIEVLYPVHCAVLGGNLKLLKWLVDKQYCPIQAMSRTRVGVVKKQEKMGPLLSSKGRSVLGIALSEERVDFIRYLVSVKGMSFLDEKDLDVTAALLSFTTVLKMLPEPDAKEEEDSR